MDSPASQEGEFTKNVLILGWSFEAVDDQEISRAFARLQLQSLAFLGYALWVTLKHLLRRNHRSLSPAKALSLLSTLRSADIVLPTTDGREIRLRRVTTPDAEQKQLLDALNISTPERLDLDFECSVDSAAV